MDYKLSYFYGVYPGRALGNLILLDPLLPPRKCPLNCIVCPLPKPKTSMYQSGIEIPVNDVYEDLLSSIPESTYIDGVLIWGYGEPLLTRNLDELLLHVKILLRKQGFQSKTYIHSSLIPLVKTCSKQENTEQTSKCVEYSLLINQVEGFLVPFIWYESEKYLFGWPRETGFSNYINTLRELFHDKTNKLLIELYLFRLNNEQYPSPSHLDEVVIYLKKLGVKHVILKPVDRPVNHSDIKPPPLKLVEKSSEYLTREGFKTIIDGFSKPSLYKWKNTARTLYNQILRIPLKYSEIRELYSELGVIALDNLLSKGLAKRTTWSGEVYYTGIQRETTL